MMMLFLNLFLLFGLQAPAPPVVVGLVDQQQLVIENPQFSGFIETREGGEAFLLYRQQHFHGEVSLRMLSRIDFGEYRRGQPFAMTLTLKNGQKLSVQSDRRDFVMVKGRTDIGTVSVKHPDPLAAELRLSTRRPNREDDLTIRYLEFPTS
jgi:hypothetical protein